MEWVAITLHTTSQHGVSSINTTDAHTSAASSRLKCRPCRFKWTRPFRRKTKSGFCACAITFQMQSIIINCATAYPRTMTSHKECHRTTLLQSVFKNRNVDKGRSVKADDQLSQCKQRKQTGD